MRIAQCALVLPLFFSVSYLGCSNTYLFHINGAMVLEQREIEKEPVFANRSAGAKALLRGHYVGPGNNLVILIRRFDPGSPLAIDDETFEKLTIEINKANIGTPIDANSSEMKISYSTGAAAFVAKGHGVHSTLVSGHAVIRENNKGKLKVKLNLLIKTEPAGSFPFEGRTVRIDEEYTSHEISIEDLTPWLGKPSDSIAEEVYP